MQKAFVECADSNREQMANIAPSVLSKPKTQSSSIKITAVEISCVSRAETLPSEALVATSVAIRTIAIAAKGAESMWLKVGAVIAATKLR
jgi:hypothetical protein